MLKFIYSEKATKFCEISTLLLSYVVPVKFKVEISQNFVSFSEYMNFTRYTLFAKMDAVVANGNEAQIASMNLFASSTCTRGPIFL